MTKNSAPEPRTFQIIINTFMRQIKINKNITSRTSPAFDRYLKDISRIPLITPEREEHLSQAISKGGTEADKAREELVRSNLRFVVSVAKQYERKGMTLPDLVNEGNIGLLKVADRFDATRGFKFISYAVWWIRQSIMSAIGLHDSAIRLPQNRILLTTKIRQAEASASYSRICAVHQLKSSLTSWEKKQRSLSQQRKRWHQSQASMLQ